MSEEQGMQAGASCRPFTDILNGMPAKVEGTTTPVPDVDMQGKLAREDGLAVAVPRLNVPLSCVTSSAQLGPKDSLPRYQRPSSARKSETPLSARRSSSPRVAPRRSVGSLSMKTLNVRDMKALGVLPSAQAAMQEAKASVDRAVQAEASRIKAAARSKAGASGAFERPSNMASSARRGGVDPLVAHGYATMSPIANGAFSQITRARHLSTQWDVAVKTFSKAKYLTEGNEHLAKAMKNELDVLRRLEPLRHPTIANILEVVEDPSTIRAVLEYCGGGSLKRLMDKAGVGGNMARSFGLNGELSCSVATQVAQALEFIHDVGVCHRDIKPDNVLLVDNTAVADKQSHVKLCDFGFAVACGDRPVRTVCGTPQYMAPEIAGACLARREPYLGAPCDMWAFGALVFEMLEGKPAFRAASLEQLKMRIVRASHEAFTAASPQPARALIKGCLELDAATRKTAKKAVASPWFVSRTAACK